MNDDRFEQALAEAAEACARWQRVPAPARELHVRILRHFAETGGPPTLDDPRADKHALAQLIEADLVETDPDTGAIRGAYPFVAESRGHRVDIARGPTVESYCAIDTLGIPAMLGKDATIASRDPHSGEPVNVEVRGGRATWEPGDAVATVPMAELCDRQGRKAVDCVCPTTNFYASHANAEAYRRAHGLSLEILTIPQAQRLGTMTFGALLDA
jgi:hypothetical protein